MRRVTDAHVGAALAGDVQLEGRLAGGDGERNDQFAAVDFDFAEGVVLFGLAGGQDGFVEGDAVGLELEAVTVEIVAVGDVEADFDGFFVEGAGGDAEGLVGRQRLAGGSGTGHGHEGEQGREQKTGEGEKTGDADHGRKCRGKAGALPVDGSRKRFRGVRSVFRRRPTPDRRAGLPAEGLR